MKKDVYKICMDNEILQKNPEFVLQPTIISRSMHDLSVTARKLIAMAMAIGTDHNGDYLAVFEVEDFFKTLNLQAGGKQNLALEAAITECANSSIKIKTEEEWRLWPWVQEINMHKNKSASWKIIRIVFNPKISEVIKNFKKAYSKIDLADLGKLQSRYAIRFYEIALSFSGLAGKNGNEKDKWYFALSLPEMREYFKIDQRKYKLTNAFKNRIIDQPIEEINAAEIGIRIEPEYIRKGKFLIGAKFNCRWLRQGEPVPVDPATESEKEAEKLKKKYPEEFEIFYQEELKQKNLFPMPRQLQELAASGKAIERLKELETNKTKAKTQKKPTTRRK
jgi:plasmid replication initiation protein